MSVSTVDFDGFGDEPLAENASWWDPDSRATVVLSTPRLDPELWHAYLGGAERSYRRHGVQNALDVAAIADGADTATFCALLDDDGRVVGGVRAVGPLRGADDAHAVREWAGQPGQAAVRKMIDDRVPFGVAEIKSAWSTDDRGKDLGRATTALLARNVFHVMELLGLQFCLATSAPHVLQRWASSGGVVAPIPPTPYPDERYLTKMMWWDRRTFVRHADPDQVAKILRETAALAPLTALAL